METAAERRKRKLLALIKEHGIRKIAEEADLNWQSLDQVAKGHKNEPRKDGSQTAKNLGDPSARAIEAAFGLGVGWFDLDDQAPASKPETESKPARRELTQLEDLALRTLAKFPDDEARLDALYELNRLLTRKSPAPGEHNPHVRGMSLHGELDEAPAPQNKRGAKR